MIRFFISFYILLTFSVSVAFAFNDEITHPEISEKALLNSNTIERKYFSKHLSLKNEEDTLIKGEKIIEWLQYGAKMEDAPPCRASNHFHNPYLDWTASGLSDTLRLVNWWCWTSPYPADDIESNVTWATGYSDRGYIDPSSDVSDANEWDWESARLYYLAYLAGLDGENGWGVVPNEQRRNDLLTYTLEALGHLMHLLQDVAVPAHVRDDFSQGHTRYLPNHELTANFLKWFGNPFEDFVRRSNRSSWFDKEPDGGDFTDFRITDLWDTNALRADTTSEQLSQIGMSSLGLAEYTSMNFLSMFTMFKADGDDGTLSFPFPKPEHCVVRLEMPEGVFTPLERQYLASWNGHPGETVNKLATVGYLKHYRDVYFPNASNEMLPLFFDDNCYEEYAQKLIPRAIGYSSALLDYFFRGQLSVTAMPYFTDNSLKYITLNIENLTETQETMAEGHFFLLFRYTPVGGKPDGSEDIFVRAEQTPPIGELAFNESVEFSFASSELIPIDRWDTVTCSLAFRGRLGNETDAVVGKVFKPGKILFNEEWDNGITGNHDWVFRGNSDSWSTKEVVDGHLIMESAHYPEHNVDGRLNELFMNFKTDSSDGLLITPTTHVQFIIPEMSSAVGDESGANHAFLMYFNDGTIIEFTGDGPLCDWTDPDRFIPLNFDLNKIITANVMERYETANRPIPDPLYLESIQFMQLAFLEALKDYWFYMDVDAIRIFDTRQEE